MRDLVTLFVEASLAKGEWLAALHTVHLATQSADTRLHINPSHYHTIAAMLTRRGEWTAAMATLRLAPPPLHHNYTAEHLAARVRAYHDVLRGQYDTRASTAALISCEAAQTLRNILDTAAEALRGPLAPADGAEVQSDARSVTAGSDAISVPAIPHVLVASTAELLSWCQAQLHIAPAAPALTVEDKTAMMAALHEAAQVAQRRAVVLLPRSGEAQRAPCVELPGPFTQRHSDDSTDAAHALPSSPAETLPPAEVVKMEGELDALLSRRDCMREDCSRLLALLHRLPPSSVTPLRFAAVTRLLANRGLRREFKSLVRDCLYPAAAVTTTTTTQGQAPVGKRENVEVGEATHRSRVDAATVLVADSVVLKYVAEACRRLQSPHVAAELLRQTALRSHLTPSAAVPLVMVLRDAALYAPVIEWWNDLQNGEATVRYPLLQHAKLCSYVASCVVRHTQALRGRQGDGAAVAASAGWVKALSVFAATEQAHRADPALVLLFQLQLLRQVRQWEAAMQLFARFTERRHADGSPPPPQRDTSRGSRRRGGAGGTPRDPSSALESAVAVLTKERAEQWVPPARLRQLQQDVARFYKVRGDGGRARDDARKTVNPRDRKGSSGG